MSENETRCTAVSDTGVRCNKAEHPGDEQHWGTNDKGMDVVWASVTLPPPRRDA